jgi:hypothetical protein
MKGSEKPEFRIQKPEFRIAGTDMVNHRWTPMGGQMQAFRTNQDSETRYQNSELLPTEHL